MVRPLFSSTTTGATENVMKKIEAVVSSSAVDSVVELLDRRAISNFSLYNITAKDAVGAHTQMYRGLAYAVDLSPEIKVEAVVPDDQVSATAYAILDAARGPGHAFNPRVIITPVAEVILELHDLSPNGSGDPEPRRHRVEEEVRQGAPPALALTAVTAQASLWTAPLHLARRITTILESYLRRGGASASAPRAGTSSSKSTTNAQFTRNPARRITLSPLA
jgi:nitrogen regulatory protein P-II 1